MSLGEHEVRFKVSEKDHRRLHAICAAMGEDVTHRMRLLTVEFIEAKLHEHMLISRLLRGEGAVGESQGSGEE